MTLKKLDILHEDRDIIVVQKPAGLSVKRERHAPDVESVCCKLERAHGEVFPAFLLEADASGLLVLVRSMGLKPEFSRQFETAEAERAYVALVQGHLEHPEGLIDAPLAEDPQDRHSMIVDEKRGKPAQTRIREMEKIGSFTFLEAFPETDRKHQLRVHLASLGHPLAVDPIYGSTSALLLSAFKRRYKGNPEIPEKPLIARLPLHLQRLNFIHSRTQEQLSFEAPLPEDMILTLKQLRKWG